MFVLLIALLVGSARAADGLVEKKEFRLSQYQTASGKIISDVKVGYEHYGQLNAAKDNAILITHHFSGTSHAAGKYAADDAAPGYWDAIIGPGKVVDTNRYFVISSDTLVNVNVKDPRTITTGPASLNPANGKPYGLDFPVVSLRDFVRVQKLLLDSLDIKSLVAVMGASSGAMQAMQWAADYPDFVKRAVAVIGPGLSMPAYTIELLSLWSTPIRMDPLWNQGNYYGKTEPLEGLTQSLKFVSHSATDFAVTEEKFSARAETDPLSGLGNAFAVESGFEKTAKARAARADANSFLYMARAVQTFNVEDSLPKIQAKVLLIAAEGDMIFPPQLAREASLKLKRAKKHAEFSIIKSTGGHLAGISKINEVAPVLARFLKAK